MKIPPLIEVIREQQAGYTTSIPIYHSDGTYLAKVVGSQLYATADGAKAGIILRYPDRGTVCEMGGRTIFEIRREEAAALKTTAELYTPDGYFVRVSDSPHFGLLNASGSALQIRGMIMSGNTFQGVIIGVWIKSDGSLAIGAN